ncbi:PBECR2 nuclease fold domain-containing protein, partial [Helicobacter sp. 11S02629-2]|uniref:PBECR2 nuclease fold domain-containing protein n=1 Tax=Helicobacter sp. 11S02629-2 TaxID=1476195 RepID=UPI002150E7F4
RKSPKILKQFQKGLAPLDFIDKNGKAYTISPEVQKEWMDTFGLKNIEDTYIPSQSKEIKNALEGKDIKVQLGSLKKLVSQGRQKYIPQIKEVLENPEMIIKDSKEGFLMIKHLKDEDFFVNVSLDKGDYLVSISNGIKEIRSLNNKIRDGGEVVYTSQEASGLLSHRLLQASQSYTTNKTDIQQNATTTPKISQEVSKKEGP